MTFADIISNWSSHHELAAELGIKAEAVRKWKERGIPPRHWWPVVKAAKKRNLPLTIESIASATKPPKSAA